MASAFLLLGLNTAVAIIGITTDRPTSDSHKQCDRRPYPTDEDQRLVSGQAPFELGIE